MAGKSHTMIGTSSVSQDCGIVPCAISWLFKLINEQRQKTGARFSVRVSALAIVGKNETVKDLLSSYAKGNLFFFCLLASRANPPGTFLSYLSFSFYLGTESHIFSPAMYLREEHGLGDHLQNQSELRAPSAEKAAFYLDAAIAASRSGDVFFKLKSPDMNDFE